MFLCNPPTNSYPLILTFVMSSLSLYRSPFLSHSSTNTPWSPSILLLSLLSLLSIAQWQCDSLASLTYSRLSIMWLVVTMKIYLIYKKRKNITSCLLCYSCWNRVRQGWRWIRLHCNYLKLPRLKTDTYHISTHRQIDSYSTACNHAANIIGFWYENCIMIVSPNNYFSPCLLFFWCPPLFLGLLWDLFWMTWFHIEVGTM